MKSNQFSWKYPVAQGAEVSFIKHIVIAANAVFKDTEVSRKAVLRTPLPSSLLMMYSVDFFLLKRVTTAGDDFSSNICKVDSAEFSTTSFDDVLSNIIYVSESLELCTPPPLLVIL